MLEREPDERFIAAAVCARCGAVDRVVVRIREERLRRRCLACGYAEELALSGPSATGERDTGPQPVKIVDPSRRRE